MIQQRRDQSWSTGQLPPRACFQTLPNTPFQVMPNTGAGAGVPGDRTTMPQSAQGFVPPNTSQQHQQQVSGPRHQIQQQLERFHTPTGHYSNPVDNVWATTHNLSLIPIRGNSPLEIEARKAIGMLQTAITKQAKYSHSPNKLHSMSYHSRSRSRHGESSVPTASSSVHC